MKIMIMTTIIYVFSLTYLLLRFSHTMIIFYTEVVKVLREMCEVRKRSQYLNYNFREQKIGV